MTSRFFAAIAAVCLALSGAVMHPAMAADADVSFDFAAAHTFSGIGTQVWANTRHPAQSVELLRDINARFVRVSLVPEIPEGQLSTNMSVEQLSALIDRADSPQQRQNFSQLNDRLKQLGIQPVVIVWRMPKPWMSVRQKKSGPRKEAGLADPARIQDYANYVVAQQLYLQRMGFRPAALELTNEPQGTWDTQYKPADYADLVLKARATLDRYGLNNLRIAGPGTGIRNFDDFYAALRANGAARNLGYISAHVYQTAKQLTDPSTRGVESFLGRGKAGPIMITEFGVKKHFDDPDSDVDDNDLDVDSNAYALATVAGGLRLLGLGASAAIYWQLEDFSWSKKLHGLMSDTGQRRPVASAMQTAFGKVPTEATTTVAARGAPDDVAMQAFAGGGKLVLVMANTTNQPQRVNARFSSLPRAPSAIDSAETYTGSGPANAPLRGAALVGGVLQATVAPGSVTAIVMR